MSFTSCSKLFARLFVGILLAGAALCQSITIVSGDGQAVAPLNSLPAALVVLVRDASGNPLPNATVSWGVVTQQGGTLSAATSKTDANGNASITFFAGSTPLGNSFFQVSINATYSTKTVTFTETIVGLLAGAPEVNIALKTPNLQTNFTGPAGQQSSTLIQVYVSATVGGQAGQPIAHVLVQIGPANKGYTALLNCKEGPNLFTDVHGLATCTPVFGGQVGTGVLLITGGLNPNLLGQFTFNYQVTLGPPAIIQIRSGNNQQGQPGQPLPHSLVAQVTDIAGNPLAGIQLLFKAVVTGTVALSNVNSVSDVHGLVSATATPASNVSGPVQVSIQTTDGKIFSTFTINVAVTVGQILKSGDQQTANTLQPFADPLTVTVNDTHGNPISGVQVNFAVIQGAGTLQGSPIAVTNSQGQASASVTAGDIPGTLVITATVAANGAQTVVTFNLTVKMPGPNCTPGQTFYNGAGLQPNYISPGGIATIYCVGLAQGIQGSVVPGFFGPLPTQVAGVSLTFATEADPAATSGVPNAPIFNVSNYNGQESVSVQVPVEALVGASVPVTITVAGVSTTGVTATILQTAPGVFDMGLAGTDGLRTALILRPDGSVVSPLNALARGEIGRAYITGLIPPAGLTTDAQLPIDTDILFTSPLIVGVNNAGVPISSVKYARNLVGVWEVQFEVPAKSKTGPNLPFAVGVPLAGGGHAYSQTSDIAIQ